MLTREPAKVKSRYAYPITQYQIAIMRKFHVREDPPEIRIDWPWVKSYGDNAVKDAQRLTTGAEVLIDGYLQTKKGTRKRTRTVPRPCASGKTGRSTDAGNSTDGRIRSRNWAFTQWNTCPGANRKKHLPVPREKR